MILPNRLANYHRTLQRAGDTARGVEGLMVWAYRDQMVDRAALGPAHDTAMPLPAAVYGRVGDGLALGITPDGTGAHGWKAVHPVAETVHETVLALRFGWLIPWARRNDRPDWGEDGQTGRPVVIRCAPRTWPGGKGRMLYPLANSGRAIGCEVTWKPYDFGHLDMLHREWERWWDAMAAVAEELTRALGREVAGPPLSRRPWLDREGA